MQVSIRRISTFALSLVLASAFWTSGATAQPVPISAPTSIASPGSYVVTKNINGGIAIYADNVTVDLGGFVLSGTYATVYGNNRSNITVRHGTVRDNGNGNWAIYDLGDHSVVEDVQLLHVLAGISCGNDCRIHHALIDLTGPAIQCGYGCELSDNTVDRVSVGTGIGAVQTGTGSFLFRNLVLHGPAILAPNTIFGENVFDETPSGGAHSLNNNLCAGSPC